VTEPPLSWIVGNWRLKLLALLLAAGLMAAVAFSENPPEVVDVPVKVEYHVPDNSNLVLMGAPQQVSVPVVGLKDAVAQYRNAASGVTVDLSHARAGPNQTFWAHPEVPTSGVTPQSTAIPITMSIEQLKTVQLDVAVRTPSLAPGISVQNPMAACGNDQMPCQVTVTAPTSVLDGLSAYVNYDTQIRSAGTIRSPSQPVLFEQHGRPIDLGTVDSLPKPSWSPTTVTVKLNALSGTQIKTIPLTYQVVGSPACGYQISGVAVSPSLTATVSGPDQEVSRMTQIALDPPINVEGQSGPQITVSRPVSTGSSAVTVDPGSVKITVGLTKAFSCAPGGAQTSTAPGA
jgi:YbbR domain-containing protein